MKKHLSLWQFAGFVVTVAFGSVLHFIFSWTDALLLASISAVNESTWEHIKILFFPMLIFACVQSWFFCNEYSGYWWIKCIGILIGTITIPILFYTFTGAFGKTPAWLNVTFFFLAAGIAYFVEYLLFSKEFTLSYSWIAFILLIGVAILFITFTFAPPFLPLFQDPISKRYGLIP